MASTWIAAPVSEPRLACGGVLRASRKTGGHSADRVVFVPAQPRTAMRRSSVAPSSAERSAPTPATCRRSRTPSPWRPLLARRLSTRRRRAATWTAPPSACRRARPSPRWRTLRRLAHRRAGATGGGRRGLPRERWGLSTPARRRTSRWSGRPRWQRAGRGEPAGGGGGERRPLRARLPRHFPSRLDCDGVENRLAPLEQRWPRPSTSTRPSSRSASCSPRRGRWSTSTPSGRPGRRSSLDATQTVGVYGGQWEILVAPASGGSSPLRGLLLPTSARSSGSSSTRRAGVGGSVRTRTTTACPSPERRTPAGRLALRVSRQQADARAWRSPRWGRAHRRAQPRARGHGREKLELPERVFDRSSGSRTPRPLPGWLQEAGIALHSVGAARSASFHLYNDEEDVALATAALGPAQSVARRPYVGSRT